LRVAVGGEVDLRDVEGGHHVVVFVDEVMAVKLDKSSANCKQFHELSGLPCKPLTKEQSLQ